MFLLFISWLNGDNFVNFLKNLNSNVFAKSSNLRTSLDELLKNVYLVNKVLSMIKKDYNFITNDWQNIVLMMSNDNVKTLNNNIYKNWCWYRKIYKFKCSRIDLIRSLLKLEESCIIKFSWFSRAWSTQIIKFKNWFRWEMFLFRNGRELLNCLESVRFL